MYGNKLQRQTKTEKREWIVADFASQSEREASRQRRPENGVVPNIGDTFKRDAVEQRGK